MKGSVTAAWLAIRTNAGVALTDTPGGPCARQHGSRCWHPRLVEGSPRISDSSPHTCWNWVARSHACTPHTAATQAWEPVAPSSHSSNLIYNRWLVQRQIFFQAGMIQNFFFLITVSLKKLYCLCRDWCTHE